MGLLISILIGAVIGYFTAKAFGRHEGFLASVVIGVIGAFIGNFIFNLFGTGVSLLTLSLGSVISAVVGSVIVVLILNAIQKRS